MPADAPDTNCDFDVPANQVTVRVRTEDGAPTPQITKVSFDLNEPPPSNSRKTFGYGLRADEQGVLPLPPLPEGILEVSARAEGYQVSKASSVPITKETTTQEVLVLMRKGAGIRFFMIDASGKPSVGARIWSGDHGAISGPDGTALFDNPLAAGSPLIAYDVAGSMAFTRYGGQKEQTVRIPPSGPPIAVRLQGPDGTPIVGNGVYVGVDGVLDDKRFTDQSVAAGGEYAAGPDGVLHVAGLPAAGVLTMFPPGRSDLAVTRNLPVTDEIVFTLPLPDTKVAK